MLFESTCVKLLFLLTFTKTIASTPSPADELISQTCSFNCEDVNVFIRRLQHLRPIDSFQTVLEPLRCSTCPPKLSYLYDQLLQHSSEGALDIQSILQIIYRSTSNFNKYDVLMQTLFLVGLQPLPTWLAQDVNGAITYLVKQRYVDERFNADPNLFCKQSCQQIMSPIDVKYPKDPCICHKQLINWLLKRLFRITNYKNRFYWNAEVDKFHPKGNITDTPTFRSGVSSKVEVEEENSSEDSSGFYLDLLGSLSNTSENVPNILILRNYFKTSEFRQIMSTLQLSQLSDLKKLLVILEAIQSTSTDNQVVQTSTLLIKNVRLMIFYQNMDSIISVLPAPTNSNEELNYGRVTAFLKTEEAFNLLKHIDITLFSNDKVLLEYIITTVSESVVSEEIKEAFAYYLTVELSPVQLITRKAITKNFKFTQMLTDTLDIQNLSATQKDAFRNFFKYIISNQHEATKKFENWDLATTRGEFMKLFFQHLIHVADIPSAVKQNVSILYPLLKLDGRAALPP